MSTAKNIYERIKEVKEIYDKGKDAYEKGKAVSDIYGVTKDAIDSEILGMSKRFWMN